MKEATETVTLAEASDSQGAYVARAFAAGSPKSGLAPATIRRRGSGPEDVQIEVLYCGVCHSDLHQVRNEWSGVMPTVYPCVPGHEIIGRVTKVGTAVLQIQAWRPRGSGLHGRLRPCLPGVPGWARTVLPEFYAHVQLSRQASGRRHLRRLL
jgi:hypothetical protein